MWPAQILGCDLVVYAGGCCDLLCPWYQLYIASLGDLSLSPKSQTCLSPNQYAKRLEPCLRQIVPSHWQTKQKIKIFHKFLLTDP